MTLAFTRTVSFGRLVGVALPGEDDDAGVATLAAALPSAERAHALTLPPARRVTWAGGRVAMRAALAELGAVAPEMISSTPRGAPALPAELLGSIAHKRTVAVALAARAAGDVTLGVDVEIERAPRVDISERVLTDDERRRVDALTPRERAREVLALFAAKEALYKGLDPWLGRYVSFQEVELARDDDGARVATFASRAGEPSFVLEVHEEEAPAGHILMTARVHRRSG
ncbi:MAG TPA: 4'-phosphopantetheinyl transferase superfamily protein [Polyangia bacterium]|nr:4'-phosphopantetheinyl transferase superfamily protein [Polyangia bacterium]